MPNRFWLITYGGLLYDRTILGFVPKPQQLVDTDTNVLERFWFTDEESLDSQMKEFNAIGLMDVKAHVYKLKERKA